MKKKIILLVALFVVYTVTTIIYNLNFKQTGELSEDVVADLESRAISKILEIYPEFQPAENGVNYVAKSQSSDKWYAYVFDKRDGGQGYEVYYESGNYTTNFNKDLLLARLKLIEKMNELMPGNKQFNQYVSFNPYGIKGVTQQSSGISDGQVGYALYAESINIDEQLEIDYLLVKYASELLGGLGFAPKGISAEYYEVPGIELDLVFSETNLFRQQERGSRSFKVYFENLKKYKPKFRYTTANTNIPENIFQISEEDFVITAKSKTY